MLLVKLFVVFLMLGAIGLSILIILALFGAFGESNTESILGIANGIGMLGWITLAGIIFFAAIGNKISKL